MENWFPSFCCCVFTFGGVSFICVCVWLVGFETASLLQVGPEFPPAQAAPEVKAVILPRVWDQAWATMPGCFVVFTWEPSPNQRRAGQVTVFVPLLQCGRLSCCSPTTCALLVSTEIISFAREIDWRSVCDLVLQEYVFLKGAFKRKLRFHFEVPRIGTTTSHMWDKPPSYIPNSYLYLEMEPCWDCAVKGHFQSHVFPPWDLITISLRQNLLFTQ